VLRGEELMATIEQVCLHVDMKEGRVTRAAPEVWARLKAIADAHASLPMPEGAGRSVGQGK